MTNEMKGFIIISALLSIFSGCKSGSAGKPEIEQSKISVQINQNLEFLNSILLTSKYNEMTRPYIGYGLMTEENNEYTNAIKDFFANYQSSPIYSLIEDMVPNGFTFSRPVELMLSLGNSRDFSIQFPLSELSIQYSGGMENILTLLNQLNEFSKQTNFFEFFETVKFFYDPYLQKANDYIETLPFVSVIEGFYGKKQNSYNFILSGLMVGNYGISFWNTGNMTADIFSVFSPVNMENILSAGIIFHELSHPFINPLTEKHHDIVEKYSRAYEWLNKYKLPDYQSGYGDWQECVNEHFVRAITIHLLDKCGLNDEANQFLRNDLYRGYKYIPKILELLDTYDNDNRERYKTFDEFYPIILNVFENEV